MARTRLFGRLVLTLVGAVALGVGCAGSGTSEVLDGELPDDPNRNGGDGGAGGQGGSDGDGGSGGEGGSGGGGSFCESGCPEGFWDLDGDPLTGDCGCEYACTKTSNDDAIDRDFVDANCDGTDGVVERCVFVAPTGDDSNSGTRFAPKKTIWSAVQEAEAHGIDVCLGAGTWDEQVQLPSGVSLYGGFDQDDPDFAFRRKSGVQSIIRSTGTAIAVPSISVDTHIAGVIIEALTPAAAGGSTYGIWFGGGTGTLYVRNNEINTGPGQDGADGKDADATTPSKAPDGHEGSDGCSGSVGSGSCKATCGVPGEPPVCSEPGGKGGLGGCNNGNGTSGSAGSGGASGGAGGAAKGSCGGNGGKEHGADGDPGEPGVSGGSGAGGTNGTIQGGLYKPGDGKAGGEGMGGKGGGGGGGGAGGHFSLNPINACIVDAGGGGGSGGCGGKGGKAGAGGQGGGGSFGVFAASGRIVVTKNTILPSVGGKGGNGGAGAPGQLGGDGGPGGRSSDDGGQGGKGGKGGDGGSGGPGGGGAGGPSTCVAYSASTLVTYEGNSCQPAGGGDGGSGGADPRGGFGNPGAKGQSGFTLQL